MMVCQRRSILIFQTIRFPFAPETLRPPYSAGRSQPLQRGIFGSPRLHHVSVISLQRNGHAGGIDYALLRESCPTYPPQDLPACQMLHMLACPKCRRLQPRGGPSGGREPHRLCLHEILCTAHRGDLRGCNLLRCARLISTKQSCWLNWEVTLRVHAHVMSSRAMHNTCSHCSPAPQMG